MKTTIQLTKEIFKKWNVPFEIKILDDPSRRWDTSLSKENVKIVFLERTINQFASVCSSYNDVITNVTIDFFDYCVCDLSNRIGINFIINTNKEKINASLHEAMGIQLKSFIDFVKERFVNPISNILGEVTLEIKNHSNTYMFNMSMNYDFFESMNIEHLRRSIIDIIEDFLDAKGVEIENDEKEDADNPAIIYGSDYDRLANLIDYSIKTWLE